MIAGFTSGIAVIIFIGQLRELLGLRVALPVMHCSKSAFRGASPSHAVAGGRRWDGDDRDDGLLAAPLARVPPAIFALIGLTIVAHKLAFPIETIGTRFGGIPQGFPGCMFRWSVSPCPGADAAGVHIAMLGAIESLLSAMVADGMIAAGTTRIRS